MSAALYLHALRSARRRQLAGRAARIVTRRRFPAARAARIAAVRDVEALWRSPAFAHADRVAREDDVDVLGLRVPFPPPDWSLPGEPRLRRFHLHYGDEVLGWARRGDAARARAAAEAWLGANPPRRGDAWHPYTVSQRIGNWVAAATLAPELVTQPIAESLARQAAYLASNVEDDVLGNHVIANARALVLAGRALGERRLVARGAAVLHREIPDQVLPDGGHYERSPVYHALVLRDLLEARAADVADLDNTIARMERFAAALTRPDGLPAPFNDAPLELAPRLELPPPADGTVEFPDTGYTVVREGDVWLAFDCGPPAPPYLPPHAHADVLSFQLWHRGEAVVIDPGTFTYEPGADRDWFRSTQAHSTVTVDGRNQFELWGAFRSGPMPRVSRDGALAGSVSYSGVVHRRTLELRRGELLVDDEVSGGHPESRLPLARTIDIDAERWDVGFLSERLYERREIPVAVSSRPGWRIPLAP